MIARIRGELLELGGSVAVVDAGGVGYEISLPESVAVQLPAIGERVDLWIRQVFREDGVSLYGFMDVHQRRVFDLLTEVKGCGPRIGLALLGQLGEQAVITAIVTQDAKALARASGVGPRLAERILLELKDKIQEAELMRKVGGSSSGGVRPAVVLSDELVDALLALGYRRAEAETVAEQARAESEDLQEQIRFALKKLAR